MNELKTAGEFYFKKSWNVIPFNFGKAILKNNKIEKTAIFDIDYGIYHKEKITQNLIDQWWGEHNAIAVVTGKISGITVIDVDTKILPEIKDLPNTFTVETHRGFHFF